MVVTEEALRCGGASVSHSPVPFKHVEQLKQQSSIRMKNPSPLVET